MTKFARRNQFKTMLRTAVCSVAVVGLWTAGTNAIAQETAPLSTSELTSIINGHRVGAKATNLRVVGGAPNVIVLAEKDDLSNEGDLKVDAIFVTKALVTAEPKLIKTVKIIFSEGGEGGKYVVVTRQEIEDYGSGKTSPEKLMTSLSAVPVIAESTPDAVPGPELERRLIIWQRIDKLRQHGTGTKPFETLYAEAEAAAKQNDAKDVHTKLAYLETKLRDQEAIFKDAKRSIRGLGVPALPASHQPSKPAAGQTQPAGGPPTYVPPEAEYLRSMFERVADQAINDTDAKDHAQGQALRQLKQQIQLAFATGKRAEAFSMIRRFQMAVQQVTGIDPFVPSGGPGGGPPGLPGGGPGGGPNGGPGGDPPGLPGGGPAGGPNGGPGGSPGGGPQ